MLEPLAVSLCSERRGYVSVLERQLKREGIEFQVEIDQDFSWRRRALWAMKKASDNQDRLLLFLDPWDVVFCGTKSELMHELYQSHITVSGDRNCWPDPQFKTEYFFKDGDVLSPWRYVNVGVIIGPGSKISEAMEWGWQRFPIVGDHRTIVSECGSDQRFWTKLYLFGGFNIKIDTECRMCQTAIGYKRGELDYVDGRLVNTVFGTRPLFMHANGGPSIPEDLLK